MRSENQERKVQSHNERDNNFSKTGPTHYNNITNHFTALYKNNYNITYINVSLHTTCRYNIISPPYVIYYIIAYTEWVYFYTLRKCERQFQDSASSLSSMQSHAEWEGLLARFIHYIYCRIIVLFLW